MIAAITARAAETVAAAAPAGVDVTVPAAYEEAEFLVISDDAGVLEALPGLRAARVVQTLSAGTDRIEDHVPPGPRSARPRRARHGGRRVR